MESLQKKKKLLSNGSVSAKENNSMKMRNLKTLHTLFVLAVKCGKRLLLGSDLIHVYGEDMFPRITSSSIRPDPVLIKATGYVLRKKKDIRKSVI